MATLKTYFNWSTGKDSALALYYLLQNQHYTVSKLVTAINSHYNRVSMHGLRKALLEKQAKALDLPLQLITLPEQPSMVTYKKKMLEAITHLKNQEFTHSAFGDIFLEDLRAYREEQLNQHQIKAVFPLWKKNTKALIHEFLDLGFKTIVVCASAKYFNKDFVGTILNKDSIANLPEDVDPCGENGEFHTFCFDGPIFKTPVSFSIGETVYREYNAPKTDTNNQNETYGMWYCDLV